MQQLWLEYGSQNIGTHDDVILDLCQRNYNIDLSSFLHIATLSTMDLTLPTLLQSIGLTLNFRSCHHFKDKGGASSLSANFDIGAVFTIADKQLKVVSIQENRAASLAGLQVDDIIVAFNKWQCDENRFMQILNRSKLGQSLPIDVMRDGRLITLSFTLFPAVHDTCEISVNDMPVFEKWLTMPMQKAQ
jgi:predicted metalloprotease with PDZ domain